MAKATAWLRKIPLYLRSNGAWVQTASYAEIGTPLTVVGRTEAPDNLCWLKLEVPMSDGVGTYYATAKSTGLLYCLAGTMTKHAVKVNDASLMELGDKEIFVSIFKGKLRTEPDGAANEVGYASHGQVLHVTRTWLDGVGGVGDEYIEVVGQDVQGKRKLYYFDTKAPCPIDIKKSEYNDNFIFYDGALATLPVFDPDIAEPNDPPVVVTDPVLDLNDDAAKWRAYKALWRELNG